jgi:hypothetical protein
VDKRKIEEVKEAWEKRLMSKQGVIGVGISRTTDGKEKCIKVYVDRKDSVKRVPTKIEGYPVEVEVRGTFRPW